MSNRIVLRSLVLLFICVVVMACAGIHTEPLADTSAATLAGTWQYLITNAHSAEFVDCSGDAVGLEGMPISDGAAAAPICLLHTSFDVVMEGADLSVVPYDAACGDGSSASITGTATIFAGEVAGFWQSTSDGGVTSVQSYSGSVSGQTIQLVASTWTFEGDYQGACNISPPLTSSIQVF